MSNDPAQMSREERLAAKLRENLKRRKAQARSLGEASPGRSTPGDSAKTAGANASLPKEPPKS